jgi:hypothetical protein
MRTVVAEAGHPRALHPGALRSAQYDGFTVGPLVTIESVSQLAQAHGVLGHLDLPKEGDSVGRTLRLVGWALGRETVLARQVELRTNARTLVTVPLDQPRSDVAAAFPAHAGAGTSGFAVSVPLLGLSLLELAVDVVLDDETRLPLAEVRARPSFAGEDSAGMATLVSVVITASTGDASSSEAIESVLAQTYPNFELVLVTGSDNASVIASAKRYSGVRVVKSSPGIAAARDAGLRASSGSVLVFLDANERLLGRTARADCPTGERLRLRQVCRHTRVPRPARVPPATTDHGRQLRGPAGSELRPHPGGGDVPAGCARGSWGLRRELGSL